MSWKIGEYKGTCLDFERTFLAHFRLISLGFCREKDVGEIFRQRLKAFDVTSRILKIQRIIASALHQILGNSFIFRRFCINMEILGIFIVEIFSSFSMSS